MPLYGFLLSACFVWLNSGFVTNKSSLVEFYPLICNMYSWNIHKIGWFRKGPLYEVLGYKRKRLRCRTCGRTVQRITKCTWIIRILVKSCGCDEWDVDHVLRIWENIIGNIEERTSWRILQLKGTLILKWILKNWDVVVFIGSYCSSGGQRWTS
jgi:hypothetical protein